MWAYVFHAQPIILNDIHILDTVMLNHIRCMYVFHAQPIEWYKHFKFAITFLVRIVHLLFKNRKSAVFHAL